MIVRWRPPIQWLAHVVMALIRCDSEVVGLDDFNGYCAPAVKGCNLIGVEGYRRVPQRARSDPRTRITRLCQVSIIVWSEDYALPEKRRLRVALARRLENRL